MMSSRPQTASKAKKKKKFLKKKETSILKSSSLLEVLRFLDNKEAVSLQQLSRMFYNSVIPRYFHFMRVPMTTKFYRFHYVKK